MAGKTNLIGSNLIFARKLLLRVASLLDKHKIIYHLEGGTLLGIVRNKDLLPWDSDLDISIMEENTNQLMKLRFQFLLEGLILSKRFSKFNYESIRRGTLCLIKIKPLVPYLIRLLIPNFSKGYIPLDVFIKSNNKTHTFWQAEERVMRVDRKYYDGYETIEFLNHVLKCPTHHRDYLTQKYGDWSVPVKEWKCSENELTVIKS